MMCFKYEIINVLSMHIKTKCEKVLNLAFPVQYVMDASLLMFLLVLIDNSTNITVKLHYS